MTSPDLSVRKQLLTQLNDVLSQLYDLFRSIPDPDIEIYEGWSAKDILGHITFWHESFARNLSDLAAGLPPSPLKGKYADLNRRMLVEMQPLTVAQILEKLQNAQSDIQANILSEKLVMIPYRLGSRDYSPEDHLQIVIDHIQEHMRGIQKALPPPAGT